jgi:hypothetical protein
MSPFDWKKDPRPSIFAKDAAFRPRAAQTYAHLTPEENVVAYKAFSIHSRAVPSVKPTLNKHELPKGRL